MWFEVQVDAEEGRLFEQTARRVGMTSAEALKVFVRAFNAAGGFPFQEVTEEAQPFASEQEALAFSTAMAEEIFGITSSGK